MNPQFERFQAQHPDQAHLYNVALQRHHRAMDLVSRSVSADTPAEALRYAEQAATALIEAAPMWAAAKQLWARFVERDPRPVYISMAGPRPCRCPDPDTCPHPRLEDL